METVFRVAIVYFFLMVGLRVIGKRDFSQLSPFDLVTLLLIPEIVQQAMIGEDFSLTNALIAVCTLFVLVFLTSTATHKNMRLERIIEGEPTVVISGGKFVPANMNKERLTPDEIYGELHKSGLARLEQVQWGILETDGKLSFIPFDTRDLQMKPREEQVH